MKKSTGIVLCVLSMLIMASCGGDNSTGPEENVAPTIKGVTASTAAAMYGALVTITANASDENKDALTYTWSCTGGSFSNVTTTDSGRAAVTSSGKISWKAPAITDTFTISVIVSDKLESVNSSVDVPVLGFFVENFADGFSNWSSERCTASISNKALKLVSSGTSSDYPYGGSYYELSNAVPIPYRLRMKVAWVTAVPSDYGIGPYIYVKDTGNPSYNKFALLMTPSSTTANFYLANTPMVLPRFNQNDYNPLFGGKSNRVPTEANQWVEVTIAVSANKVLEVSLEGRSVASIDITSLESQFGRTIDMTLKRVGFDLHVGTAMMDDVIIDIPKISVR
jgi:hypothetical protein